MEGGRKKENGRRGGKGGKEIGEFAEPMSNYFLRAYERLHGKT